MRLSVKQIAVFAANAQKLHDYIQEQYEAARGSQKDYSEEYKLHGLSEAADQILEIANNMADIEVET